MDHDGDDVRDRIEENQRLLGEFQFCGDPAVFLSRRKRRRRRRGGEERRGEEVVMVGVERRGWWRKATKRTTE